MKKGVFITLEGGEGCGKSTQIRLLGEALRAVAPGREIIVTRSPGGTPAAEKIRSVLKEPLPGDDLTAETELMLFAACHAQMCAKLIKPALERGAILLADRFCDSTEVYQGAARGLSAEWIRKVCDFVRKGTTPDLTLLLDIDPAAGLARTRSRSQNPENDRFDSENLGFHTAVRNGFLELARREPGRICVIDASADAQTVQQNIREVCRERLGLF